MNKANKLGYAISLKFLNITDISLNWALNELLYNPSYDAKAKHISRIFQDRPLRPLDESIFWIEYIIRHNGASHLRSSALDLSWFSYFMFDALGLLISVVTVVIALLYFIVKLVLTKDKKNKSGNNYINKKTDKEKYKKTN